jgi:hypothetical protein
VPIPPVGLTETKLAEHWRELELPPLPADFPRRVLADFEAAGYAYRLADGSLAPTPKAFHADLRAIEAA